MRVKKEESLIGMKFPFPSEIDPHQQSFGIDRSEGCSFSDFIDDSEILNERGVDRIS